MAGLSAPLVKLVAQLWNDHVRPPSFELLTATAPSAGYMATKAKYTLPSGPKATVGSAALMRLALRSM
jgi:hypothetical protein